MRTVVLSALFLAAAAQTGTIQDVEHIVIFMQENRPFDHYFGTLRGVRGFDDKAHPLLPNGRPVWYQPVGSAKDPESADSYMLPFPLSFRSTSATCMAAPQMGFAPDIKMWNQGRMDRWNTARVPGFGMSYFNRSEMPYYYALADAFTIGDQYFQSTFTETNPNRLHLFSGSNGLSANRTTVILDDSEPPKGINWETMGETLENANISWRVFQELDNFDDNAFAWFEQFREAKPGSPLYEKGMRRGWNLTQDFETAIANKSLPQVSWLIAPTHLSEHATNHPQDGESLTAMLLKVLQKPEYADTWAKTVFILNYDEGGQFFDHHWTPTPPTTDPASGKSTITTEGDITKVPVQGIEAGTPIGPGFRVPFIIASPWTRGGYVFSEVADHTSVIKFVEKRFGVKCPNISPWRRAVTSDLLSAFDFTKPDYSWPSSFPDTSNNRGDSYNQCKNNPPPKIPTEQSLPTQEPGTRPARATRYSFDIGFSVSGNTFTITIQNQGSIGVALQMHNLINRDMQPRRYMAEAGKSLSDSLTIDSTYAFAVHGPNGFVRQIGGSANSEHISFFLKHDETKARVVLSSRLAKAGTCELSVIDNAYGQGTENVQLSGSHLSTFSIAESGNWYDLTATVRCGDVWQTATFMGRMETGRDLTSDPSIGSVRGSRRAEEAHPLNAPHLTDPEQLRWTPTECAKSRARTKDQCALLTRDEL